MKDVKEFDDLLETVYFEQKSKKPLSVTFSVHMVNNFHVSGVALHIYGRDFFSSYSCDINLKLVT